MKGAILIPLASLAHLAVAAPPPTTVAHYGKPTVQPDWWGWHKHHTWHYQPPWNHHHKPTHTTTSVAPTPTGGESPSEASQRAEAVKDAFQTAWDGYYKYAFPNDELHPVSNGFSNSRNGWGASAADAFSTALLMGKGDIVNEILNYIPTINWSVSYNDEQVSLFETTIRYLGGILSGYDLLMGPRAGLAKNQDNVPKLLQSAVDLANNLSYAFDTPSGIPSNNLYFGNKTTDGSTTNGLATIGTLVLEWTHLSDLTGNPDYARLTQKAESYLLSPQPASSEPWPGLVGTNVDLTTGKFVDAYGGWNGGDDSFYEYLIKMYVYNPSKFGQYKDRWIAAVDSSIAHLASHPKSRPDLTFLAGFNGKQLDLSSGHLACFDGGNFILGGLVLKEQKYVDFGLALTDACEDTYNQTVTGIGPEGFGWDSTKVPADQQAFYQKAGYYITSSGYYLRPEVLESFYYAYRATGDRKYQDYAWNGIQAIIKNTRVGSGFAEINNVNAADHGGFNDFMDSFWFAEVLKYAYLIHAPNEEFQVNFNGKNPWVFNTEAHPFKVAGTPI